MTKDETSAVEISDPQVWELEIDGRQHRVETSTGSFANKVFWWVDGDRIAAKSAAVSVQGAQVPALVPEGGDG